MFFWREEMFLEHQISIWMISENVIYGFWQFSFSLKYIKIENGLIL